jgi:hypothetical protein
VLLRFTADSVERHESLLPTGNKEGQPTLLPPRRHRTRHRSWPGVLSVECNWSEEEEAAAAEAMQEQPAHGATESVEELLHALRSVRRRCPPTPFRLGFTSLSPDQLSPLVPLTTLIPGVALRCSH